MDKARAIRSRLSAKPWGQPSTVSFVPLLNTRRRAASGLMWERRDMSKIVFVQLPEMGHLNPSLKLARNLSAQGHEVSYVGLLDFQDYIRAQGLGFLSILEAACPRGFLQQNARKQQNSYEWLVELTRAGAPEIYAALGRVRPDLLMIDVELRGVLPLAQQLGIPCALISTNLQSARFDEREDPASKGLPVIVLCPRELDFPSTFRLRGRYFIEPCIELERKEVQAFPWEKLDETKPLIYCSLGSHAHDYGQSKAFFHLVVNAMRLKPDRQLLLAMGRLHGDPLDFQDVPSNVLIVNWAPQLEILKRASIMITHGGLGTIKECIFFEVPMIIFPAMLDQPENAARVAHHGLGVSGRMDRASIHHIHSLIESIERNSSLRANLAAMSRTFREIENSRRGVHIIERILAWLRDNGPALYQPLASSQPEAFHQLLSVGWQD
jgi:UDP:flavonoid glycosyltransferase YjiC (YdhE family)